MTSHWSILLRLRRNCRPLFAPIGILGWSDDSLPGYQRSKLPTGANEVAIVSPACFAGISHAIFLCTAALPGDYLREMKAMKFLKRNFLRKFNGLSVLNWVRKPILAPQWIQFVHLATHFGRCLVRELQLLETNGRPMLGVCVCLTECFRRYKWHRG